MDKNPKHPLKVPPSNVVNELGKITFFKFLQ